MGKRGFLYKADRKTDLSSDCFDRFCLERESRRKVCEWWVVRIQRDGGSRDEAVAATAAAIAVEKGEIVVRNRLE